MITYPFEAAGALTRVLEAGDAKAAPLVLVHGVGARADRWQRNVDPLAAAGYHVYALDLPGHGFAAKGGRFEYSVAGYTDFLQDFVRRVADGPAVLVGTSLGGAIAASLACRAPDAVRALVLVGSLGLRPVGPDVRARMRGGIRDTTRDGIRGKLQRVLHDPRLIDDAWVEEEFRINNSPGAAEAFARLADYFADHIDDDVVGDRLAALAPRWPILLVWGAEEKSVPVAVGEAVHRLLPGSRLVVLPAAAHAPYFEQAEAFNRAVIDFLAQANPKE
jgi:pimeloyl-ACP methyl ester carboxylesterase